MASNISNNKIARELQLSEIINQKSCFLFGPRQTGKSTLIKQQLADAHVFDLLDSTVLRRLSRAPELLAQEAHDASIVVIDEIQLLPELLNEVHRLIESRDVRFVLTGSSARALRRRGVNLLGGRARSRTLHPFTQRELGAKFDFMRALLYGTIPSIYFSDAPQEDLERYCGDYLQLEIAAEGLARNIPAFSRFLSVAALTNGQQVNFTEMANDAQVARTTVHEYMQILYDTLLAFELPAWREGKSRKPITSSKYYFFDIGVTHALQQRTELAPKSVAFGQAFESYIFHELRSYCDYHRKGSLSYWRSTSGFEVDFIYGQHCAIECKAKANVQAQDLKGLRALVDEAEFTHRIVVACVDAPRITEDGIHILPWQEFLRRLYDGVFDAK